MTSCKIQVRVNMVDTFSKATHSVTKIVSQQKLAQFEQAQINGTIIRQHRNGITYHWQIEEVEVLDINPKLFPNGIS